MSIPKTAGDVIVLADFWHVGFHYQMVTWCSDGHARMRLVVQVNEINDALGPEWELIWIQR